MIELLASYSFQALPPTVIGATAAAGVFLLGMLKRMRDEKSKKKPQTAPVVAKRRR